MGLQASNAWRSSKLLKICSEIYFLGYVLPISIKFVSRILQFFLPDPVDQGSLDFVFGILCIFYLGHSFCYEVLGFLKCVVQWDPGSLIFISSWDPGDPGSCFSFILRRDRRDPDSYIIFCWVLGILKLFGILSRDPEDLGSWHFILSANPADLRSWFCLWHMPARENVWNCKKMHEKHRGDIFFVLELSQETEG